MSIPCGVVKSDARKFLCLARKCILSLTPKAFFVSAIKPLRDYSSDLVSGPPPPDRANKRIF